MNRIAVLTLLAVLTVSGSIPTKAQGTGASHLTADVSTLSIYKTQSCTQYDAKENGDEKEI